MSSSPNGPPVAYAYITKTRGSNAALRTTARVASPRLRDVRIRDGRAVWARRHGDDERAGVDAALSLVHSIFLVHSGFACSGGGDHCDSRGRRILPLGARGLRRLLGIPGRLVELERFVPSGGDVRRSDRGLSDVFLPRAGRLEALRDCRRRDCDDWLHQRARHPDGWRVSDDPGDLYSRANRGAVRNRGNEVAPQSVFAAVAAARSAVSSFRRGAGAGLVALLRLRAGVQRCGRSGKPAAQLSDRTRGRHSTLHRDVFSADDVLARGAWRLGGVAHRIFFRCRAADRRALAGFCDDHRGDDHQSFAAERHGADQHAHAVHYGGGRLSSRDVFGAPFALWHAVDRHHRVFDRLRAAGAEDDGAASDRLRVVAHRRNDSDGAFLVAVAQDAAGFAAAVSHSLGPRRTALRDRCAAGDERGRVGSQRPVRAAVGTGGGAAGTDHVSCASRDAKGKRKRRVLTQSAQRTQSTQRRKKKKQEHERSGEEIEDSVPCAGKRERPRVTAAQAEWRAAKRYAIEGNVVGLAADEAGEFQAEPGGGGDAVARKTRGKVHAVNFSRVRHDVQREIESAAPDEFDFGFAQLRVDGDHAAAENFGALANGVFGFRKEGGAASEEHTIVRREAVVVEKMLRVVDHAVARAEFARQIAGQNFRRDDVRADGNDFFAQRGSRISRVRAAGENHFARGDGAI